MSCTVVAIPFALAQLLVLSGIVSTTAAAAMEANNMITEKQNKVLDRYAEKMEQGFQEEVQHIQVSDIIEKEFETAYTDKDILMKTLEEHGLIEIEEDYEGKITGIIDSFNLSFEKPSSDKPYNLKISCRKSDCAEEKMDDLNSEYALNVQEEAYLKLLERLKENNMQIEEEVVEDDNTIVLTINLE